MEPEIDQFTRRRLEQEHEKGNHSNPETEEEYMHLQTNCPSCLEDHIYGLMDDHEEGLHKGNFNDHCLNCHENRQKAHISDHNEGFHNPMEHPNCPKCNELPFGEDHSAEVLDLNKKLTDNPE